MIEHRLETQLLLTATGAGISNTLALVSETGGSQRFPDGEHLASFLGLTTSKHISGATLFRSKHITKQGSPNARYAAVTRSAARVMRWVAPSRNISLRVLSFVSRRST